MGHSSRINAILRSAGLPAMSIIIMGAFAYNAVLGPNGIVAYKDFREQVNAKTVTYQDLDKKRAVIRNRVELLDPKKGADPDLVEELLHGRLNAYRADEIILQDGTE